MWELDFISREDFKNHVANTIKTYDNTLKGIDLTSFNNNIIDPIKLTFDSKVYKKSLEVIINEEIARQRDRTNVNAIGYFHQNMFKYIKNCEVPSTGYDVIYTRPNGSKVFVEMKNKHNTMNSTSSQKTFMRMVTKLLDDDNCQCYLVEIIAKRSQNIIWHVVLDNQPVEQENIRRVSIDKFYEEVTGNKKAFYLICQELPKIIDEIISENSQLEVEEDTVIKELRAKDPELLKALYLLAFNTYEGFNK